MKNTIFNAIPKTLFLILTIALFVNCSKSINNDPVDNPPIVNPNTGPSDVDFWLTQGNQSVKLTKQNAFLQFNTTANSFPAIEVDETQTFQTIDGFGYTLTGGSAQVINGLNGAKKTELLQELFGANPNSIGISYLRISIGASDLNQSVFTYNDGAVNRTLSNFSLTPVAAVISLLKEILLINPAIKIMGSPWTAPAWMKTNNSFKGGSLQPQYYQAYANYFVKYIQQMGVQGINIKAITVQNEPENAFNNPSMLMTAAEQTNFIKNNLGPAFQAANIATKIVIFDHNCDNNGQYPINVLSDPAAAAFIDGSAFHLYAGDISTMSIVRNFRPTKNVYFTEQWTGGDVNGSNNFPFDNELKGNVKNVVIGSMRNWSKTALQWNLAADQNYDPHTNDGGCTACKGAITVSDSNTFTRNVAYYIIGHASKFVPVNSVRIGSTQTGNLFNVAFKTPTGKKVLIVLNDGATNQIFKISFNGKWVTTALDGGSVGTFVW